MRSKAGAGTAAGNGSNASLSVDANVVDSSTGVGRGSMKGSGKSSRRSELRRISWDIQITCPEVVGKAAAGPSSAHARDKKTATWAGAGASGSRVEDMKGTAEKEKEKKEVPTPTHHRHSAPAIWPMFSTGFSAAANSSLRKARTVLVVDGKTQKNMTNS